MKKFVLHWHFFIKKFNVVLGPSISKNNIFYACNHHPELKSEQKVYKLQSDELYGCTNGHLEQWPKLKRGKQLLSKILKGKLINLALVFVNIDSWKFLINTDINSLHEIIFQD